MIFKYYGVSLLFLLITILWFKIWHAETDDVKFDKFKITYFPLIKTLYKDLKFLGGKITVDFGPQVCETVNELVFEVKG